MAGALEVAIAAGGTAGHINPALALAEELTARGHHVTFYGQRRRLEGTLVPEAGYDFSEIEVTGIDRERPWTAISALWRMKKASGDLNRRFKRVGAPQVAVGFGAYVEMPLLRWCAAHKVPYVIHEQNSVPGLANKTCAKNAASVCVSFPGAKGAFEGKVSDATKLEVTGNPVRQSVISASREAGRRAFGVSDDETMLLVFGGSLGARHLNEALVGLSAELMARPKLRVIHSTGKELYDEVQASLEPSEDLEQRWQVRPYIDNMGEALAAADLVVSRAGASSIAEIAALAVPSVLVPYPLATADHQTTNAHLLVDCGAARLVPDDQLDTPAFSEALLSLVDKSEERETMRQHARELAPDRAAAALANAVEAAARG
ncbi:MAG: undecaprenyldiphospho-muramoylpentapeptide beta-N-acetylglucosaminyltransferase [Coriobacteriales bacterium]|nr:undecaprenyldiphospho-muramoylpentapeptide beta-N-acetylglucosaminyltransferase [Coriobacteriales bacterium]